MILNSIICHTFLGVEEMARDVSLPRHKLQSFCQSREGRGCFIACPDPTTMQYLVIEQCGMHKNIATVIQW